MQITLSSRGQIVLPAPVRRRLRLKARDRLDLEEREGGVFLRPTEGVPSFKPVKPLPPGALKFGPADYELDRFADAAGEDDTP